MRIVRQSQFKSSPWKNGGGITHEAMRSPLRGDVFRWRVSVAHIDNSGAFSDFAGYARTMVLLRGSGVSVKLSDGTQRIMRAAGDLAQFDGALGVECELLKGPCVDLNLMIAKSDGVAARVERFMESLVVSAGRNETLAIFAIDRRFKLEITAGKTVTLEPWDLAVLSHGSGRLHRLETANTFGSTSVFLATLKFVNGE